MQILDELTASLGLVEMIFELDHSATGGFLEGISCDVAGRKGPFERLRPVAADRNDVVGF